MNAQEIIVALRKLKVLPVVDGGQLKLTGQTADLPEELLAAVRDAKGELIFLGEQAWQAEYTPIPPVSPNACYKVSDAQKRIWLLSQREGGKEAYNIVTGLWIKDNIDYGLMEQALQIAVKKHESLRTVFKEVDFEPRQVILDNLSIKAGFSDLSAHGPTPGNIYIVNISSSSIGTLTWRKGHLYGWTSTGYHTRNMR